MSVLTQPQMCTVDDITGEEPCLRVAQVIWHPTERDHPVYLCNFHAEPFADVLVREVAGTPAPEGER